MIFIVILIVLTQWRVVMTDLENGLQVSYLDFDKALELIEYIRTLPCASYVLNDGFHRHRVVIDPSQEDVNMQNAAGKR